MPTPVTKESVEKTIEKKNAKIEKMLEMLKDHIPEETRQWIEKISQEIEKEEKSIINLQHVKEKISRPYIDPMFDENEMENASGLNRAFKAASMERERIVKPYNPSAEIEKRRMDEMSGLRRDVQKITKFLETNKVEKTVSEIREDLKKGVPVCIQNSQEVAEAFLAKFREILEKEGVDKEKAVQAELNIKTFFAGLAPNAAVAFAKDAPFWIDLIALLLK